MNEYCASNYHRRNESSFQLIYDAFSLSQNFQKNHAYFRYFCDKSRVSNFSIYFYSNSNFNQLLQSLYGNHNCMEIPGSDQKLEFCSGDHLIYRWDKWKLWNMNPNICGSLIFKQNIAEFLQNAVIEVGLSKVNL